MFSKIGVKKLFAEKKFFGENKCALFYAKIFVRQYSKEKLA